MAFCHLCFLSLNDGSAFRCACDAFTLVGAVKYKFDGSVKLGYTYQYDAMDRITEVRKSSSPNSQYLAYEYDALGQLVSATDHAAEIKLPIPFSDKKLYVGTEGELFAVGVKAYWDREKGRVVIGVADIVGVALILGLGGGDKN